MPPAEHQRPCLYPPWTLYGVTGNCHARPVTGLSSSLSASAVPVLQSEYALTPSTERGKEVGPRTVGSGSKSLVSQNGTWG
jgi:hypothetical protein